MFYVLNWFVVIILLALWSLLAWGFHTVTVWTVSNAGTLAGSPAVGEGLRLPEGLTPWVPPEVAQVLASMVSAFAPLVESVVASVPALAGGLSVAIWLIWALGAVALLVLGGLGTGLIAVLRRRHRAPAAAAAAPMAAR